MQSRIVIGKVMHARLDPKRHAFAYPLFFLSLDPDELTELDRASRLFGYNRLRPLAIHDRDFLEPGERPLGDKARDAFAAAGLPRPARIQLVTCPRYLGYLFNPVSFYYGLDEHGDVLGALAEVNNTFGERTLYPLTRPEPAASPYLVHFSAAKNFHVSPFNDLEGVYQFDFAPPGDRIDVRVDLEKQGRIVFKSRWYGEGSPLTTAAILRAMARLPFAGLLTMARIHWEAAKLYFGKRLAFHPKPVPASPTLLRRKEPTRLESGVMNLLYTRLEQADRGALDVTGVDGSVRRFGNPNESRPASWVIRDHRLFRRLASAGDIGLGEAFMAGEWTSDDPAKVLEFLVLNRRHLEGEGLKARAAGAAMNWLRHRLNANSRRGSRANIQAHYDLSNDFFRLFLDPSMMYSCALFDEAHTTLEQAQQNKIRAIIDKARIEPHHHVLEIGSGWGSFALEAARLTGCRVTSITLSEQQLVLARERARLEGLDDRVTFELIDYRDVSGQFDRIVSIEMIEAVGHRYLKDYFGSIERLLKPDGLVVLQAITIPEQRYDRYRKRPDWIQKYIFPGGHLPSLGAIQESIAGHSRLMIEDLDNIGPHYAATLRMWREAFETNRDRVRALGFDDTFQRTWIYYLCYCEAAFATRTLNTLHLVLTRPHNRSLDQAAPAARTSSAPAKVPARAR